MYCHQLRRILQRNPATQKDNKIITGLFYNINVHNCLYLSAICALTLYLMSLVNGLLTLKAYKLNITMNVVFVKFTHYVTSIGTLFCATASLCFGYNKRSFRLWIDNEDALYTLMTITWIFTFFVYLDFWIASTLRLRNLFLQQY